MFTRAMPTTDITLTHYGLNQYAAGYLTRRIHWTVPAVQLHAQTQDQLKEVEDQTRRLWPDVLFNSYISGAKVQPNNNRAYWHSAPVELFDPDTELITYDGETFWIRLENPKTAQKLQDWMIPEVIGRGWPLLHIDNIVPPWAWSGAQSWESQTEHLRIVTQRLHAHGIRTEVNSATVPGFVSDEDMNALAEVTDGLNFEMSWHPQVTRRRDKVVRQMEMYRRWLDQGKMIGWYNVVPRPRGTYPIEVQDAEARFLAALAMCLRESGDFLWVSARFWRDEKDWARWPSMAGEALDTWKMPDDAEPPATIERTYKNGRFVADLINRDGKFIPNKDDSDKLDDDDGDRIFAAELLGL